MSSKKTKSSQIIDASKFGIKPSVFPKSVIKTLDRIESAGFSAWLVGGCLRDLVLGADPKDYDIVTSGTPNQIKQIFRRKAIIIGKRFRLVHIYTSDGVIEVSTLRADSHQEGITDIESERIIDHKGKIQSDNIFGTELVHDVWRRDFSVNALYYDNNNNTIIDYSGGLEDLANNQLRLIGEVAERVIEDPMRLLRAVRFEAKLAVEMDKALLHEMSLHKQLINDLPPARLFDESLKLFQKGHAVKSYEKLTKYRLLDYFLPQVQEATERNQAMSDLVNIALTNSDNRVSEGKFLNPAFILAVFLWPLVVREFNKLAGRNATLKMQKASSEVLMAQNQRMRIPRRYIIVIQDMWFAQLRFTRFKHKSIRSLSRTKNFRAAYDFLYMRSQVDSDLTGVVQWWEKFQENRKECELELPENLGTPVIVSLLV